MIDPGYLSALAEKHNIYKERRNNICRDLLEDIPFGLDAKLVYRLPHYRGLIKELKASGFFAQFQQCEFEVQTPMGYADFTFGDSLVEVKAFGCGWKTAVGQLLIYNRYLKKANPILMFINPPGRNYSRELFEIVTICADFNISVWMYQRNGRLIHLTQTTPS
jgi:hypothetical protein